MYDRYRSMNHERYETVNVEVGLFGRLSMYRCRDCGSMVAGQNDWAVKHDNHHDRIDAIEKFMESQDTKESSNEDL